MTLNSHFVLKSVLWSSEAWLSKLGYSVSLTNLNQKEQLWHRAVSLRLHGFLLL